MFYKRKLNWMVGRIAIKIVLLLTQSVFRKLKLILINICL
jgi:hypothetical protein